MVLLSALKLTHNRSDKNIDYDKAPNRVKWQQDKASLMEVITEFDTVGRLANEGPMPFNDAGDTTQLSVVDEMTRGLSEHLASARRPADRKLSLWLILATSIHLDIRRVLKGDIDRPYKEMTAVNGIIHQSIEHTLDYHKNLKIVGWTKTHDTALRSLKADVNFWNNPVLDILLGGDERLYLKRHPWICGLFIHDVRTRFHNLGICLEVAFGGILYSGHLYNALQREKLISQKWDDMELFYHLQGGRDKFFVGAAPADAADYHKQLCMVMGFSATNFTSANRRNRGKLQTNKAGPRHLNFQARVSILWTGKFRPNSARVNLAPEDVQAILEVGQAASKKRPGSRQVTPTELITDLALALQKEVPELAADYFAMHRTCWSFLRLVRESVHEDMLKWTGPNYQEGDYQLPHLVGWIFQSVCGDEGEGAGSRNPGVMPTMGLLLKAARVFNEAERKLGKGWYESELKKMKNMKLMIDRAMEVPDI